VVLAGEGLVLNGREDKVTSKGKAKVRGVLPVSFIHAGMRVSTYEKNRYHSPTQKVKSTGPKITQFNFPTNQRSHLWDPKGKQISDRFNTTHSKTLLEQQKGEYRHRVNHIHTLSTPTSPRDREIGGVLCPLVGWVLLQFNFGGNGRTMVISRAKEDFERLYTTNHQVVALMSKIWVFLNLLFPPCCCMSSLQSSHSV